MDFATLTKIECDIIRCALLGAYNEDALEGYEESDELTALAADPGDAFGQVAREAFRKIGIKEGDMR